MTNDFQNAAEREQFEENLARAQAVKTRKAEAEQVAPADPIETLSSRLPEGNRANFMAAIQKRTKVGTMAIGGLISENKEQVDAAGRSVPVIGDVLEHAGGASKVTAGFENFAGAAGVDATTAALFPGNTLQQIPAGVIDAYNEVNKFGSSLDVMASDALGYWPALQVLNEAGDLDLSIVDKGADNQRDKTFGTIENDFEDPLTMTGGLTRGVAQFAGPTAAGLRAQKALGILQNPGEWTRMSRWALAGFATDLSAFDPEMGRLSDMADEAGILPDFMEFLTSKDDDTEIESRFKNGIEGLGLGVLGEMLFSGAKGLKSVKRVKEGVDARIGELERLDSEASEAIKRDIYDQGDPNGAAVIVEAPPKAEPAAARAERVAAQPAREPVVAGEQYFDEDFFDIQRKGAADPTGGSRFSIGDAVQNRERFVAEETAGRSADAGDLIGFNTRAGDVGVVFNRSKLGATVDWDWLDNLASDNPGQGFRARKTSLQDTNEILSKVMAIVETDARANGTPVYYFSAATESLDKVYQRLVPKLAKRMGYEVSQHSGGFEMRRPDTSGAIDNLGSISATRPVSNADRLARREKRERVYGAIQEQAGYRPKYGTETTAQAARSLQRELESRASIKEPQGMFARGDGEELLLETDAQKSQRRTAEQAREHLNELRKAGHKAFGDDFLMLEQDGRIRYAREAGDLDPEWTAYNSSAQAVMGMDGEVTIFTKTVRPEQMEGIIMHEIGVHSGMEGIVGAKGFDALLKRMDDLVAAGDGAAVRARGRVPAETPVGDVSHETLAYLVQYAPASNSVVKDVVSNVKAWVAKTFPGLIDRLGLTENDFRQLALMAIRNEAIISGEVAVIFGRIGKIYELGDGPQKPKPMFGGNPSPLDLDDSIRVDTGRDAIRAIDLKADTDTLLAQVEANQDSLLGNGMAERMFDADPNFDPFLYRDTVEALAAGDARPDVVNQFKAFMETARSTEPLVLDDALPMIRDAGEAQVGDMVAVDARQMQAQQAAKIEPDVNGFTTSAEKALNNPPPRFRDAKEMTADQWRNLMRDGGATKEAFDYQIEPALKSLGTEANAKITREDLTAALEANRPKVEMQAQGAKETLQDGRIVSGGEQVEMDYSRYVSPGKNENYRQELILMPEAAEGYRSHNWETEAVVGHIRTTDRVTVGGEKTRYVDELQSDLHQEGAQYGYKGDPGKRDTSYAKLQDAERVAAERLRSHISDTAEKLGITQREVNAQSPDQWDDVRVELEREAEAALGARQQWEEFGLTLDDFQNDLAPPLAPMRDWEKPFIRRILQQASNDGIDLVTFTSYDTLHRALKNDGTKKFYNERMPAHLKKVAKELGAVFEKVRVPLEDTSEVISRLREATFRENLEKAGKGNKDAGKIAEGLRKQIAEAEQGKEVYAIRLKGPAKAKLRQGNAMFSMKKAPARMDDQVNRIVLDDIKSGRRGLDREEATALLGAAERWAAAVKALQPQRARQLSDLVEQAKTMVDPEDMRQLVEIMDGAKASVPEPPSLLTWLRKNGGVQEFGGELGARNLNLVNFVNKRGMHIDDAALAAQEAGYLGRPLSEGERVGIDDLLDAIDMELRGDKVYSEFDTDWIIEAAARQDMRAHLDSLGLDPSSSRKQIISEYERIAAVQEGQPLTLRDVEAFGEAEKAAGAKPGVGIPAKGLLGGNSVRINFNAINTSDDIRSVMGQLADAFDNEIAAARGETRTNADVIKSSRQKQAWDALSARRDGTPLTDAEVPAAQALYIASTENVKKAIELASKTGTDTAHYNARRALTMHRAIQAEIAGAKADASRALRAWSIAQTSTAQARRELNGVLEAYGGKLDPEEMARMQTLLETNPEGFDKAVRSMGRKVSDVGGEILRFAWLSGPQTHIMNLAGNSLTMAYDIGIRFGAGIKGKVLGDPALERQLSVALKEYAGVMAGVRAQFAAFGRKADYGRMGKRLQEAQQAVQQGNYKKGLMTGASALAADNPVSATFRGRFDDRGVSGTRKYDAPGSDRAISAEGFGVEQGSIAGRLLNGTGAILSAPTDFLGFADDFFKGVNELATRYRIAQDTVLEEAANGLPRDQMQARFAELVDNPTAEALEEARRTAQRRTFTEPVGEGTRTVLKARNFLNQLGFPLGHIMLPFIVTPSNILKFAFQNGPTGLLFKEIRDEMAAGGTRRAIAQSRMLAGTALLMFGMDRVANGEMTGKAPGEPGERELWERKGMQEYSLKVGDKWVSYRRMEPVSTMMAIGADLQTIFLNRELDDDSGEDMAEIIGPVLGAAIQVVTSKTYLTSAAEFIKFSEDPERYGPNYLERLLSSVPAPAIAAQTEKIQDPVIREASNVVERMMSRTPGLSDNLPVAFDLWGRPRHVSSGLGKGYDALSPFTVKTEESEPIDQELTRIGFYPKRPGKSISVQTATGMNVSVNLRNRPDIWSRYVELAGNDLKIFDGMGTKDYLNAVIEQRHPDARDYYALPDSSAEPVSKETFINHRIDQARQVARIRIQQEYRADMQAMAAASVKAEKNAETLREALATP